MNLSKQDQIAFWRTLAQAFKAGKRLTDSLGEAGAASSDTAFARIAASLIGEIEAGGTLSNGMRQFPDAFDERIAKAMANAEAGGVMDLGAAQIVDALEADDLDSLSGPSPDAHVETDQAATSEAVHRLLRQAVTSRACDIHLEPTEDRRGRVRVRIDGALHDLDPLPDGMFDKVVSRIKIMADLDVAERAMPQDGRILIGEVEGKSLDLRVCIVPCCHGERVVVRLLDRGAVKFSLSRVGMTPEDTETVRKLCRLPNGVVIVNGPTGSGKTTLLYALLEEIRRDVNCVITVEDPVECFIKGVSQIQIKQQIGYTFARALRSVFRQDPDVVMVGEIRDLEVAHLCVQCALTGHLLFTTLHASTSVGAIRRMIDIGVDSFLVNSTLAGVITQRLIRMLCPKCKKPVETVAHSLPPEAGQIVSGFKDPAFCQATGCDECLGTGYHGRTAIHEILLMDNRMRQIVADSADIDAMRDAASTSGMKTLMHKGLEKAAQGITSIEEILGVTHTGANI